MLTVTLLYMSLGLTLCGLLLSVVGLFRLVTEDAYPRFLWRWDVHRNRARHPDLRQRELAGEDRTIIAQQMMMRDREVSRNQGVTSSHDGYPVLFDYIHHGYAPVQRMRRALMLRRNRRVRNREREMKLLH